MEERQLRDTGAPPAAMQINHSIITGGTYTINVLAARNGGMGDGRA